MMITRLSLNRFRNYREAAIAPGGPLVVLSGDNGAGKTNLLEAISLLVPGRGLRRAPLADMAMRGDAGDFAVAARLGETVIGTGISPDAPGRRQVRINGARAAPADLAEWLALIWLTPPMDRLFQEGAGGRRRFFDRLALALDPAHGKECARYEQAMRERNKLLADPRGFDSDWVGSIEARMAEHGARIIAARARLAELLGEQLARRADPLFPSPSLELDENAAGDEERLRSLWREGRGKDRAAGRTLAGPHRQDIKVMHAAKNMPAANASTGEQKALLLSIVLAHADLVERRRGARPILLLDEVSAHLDPARRGALFEHLRAAGGQVWMTGTEASLFEGAGAASHFEVIDGRIEPRA